MSTVVYKYPLEITGHDIKEIRMPRGSNVLTVQVQNGVICLWAMVPPTDLIPMHDIDETRRFLVIGTGHRLPENPTRYLGTVQLMDGVLVLHVFELAKDRS